MHNGTEQNRLPYSLKFHPAESEAARAELRTLHEAGLISKAVYRQLHLTRLIGNCIELRTVTPYIVRSVLAAANMSTAVRSAIWSRILGPAHSVPAKMRRQMMTTGRRVQEFAKDAGVYHDGVSSMQRGEPSTWGVWKGVAKTVGYTDEDAVDEWRTVRASELQQTQHVNPLGARFRSIFESTEDVGYNKWFSTDGTLPSALAETGKPKYEIRRLVADIKRGERVPWAMVDRLLHALGVATTMERMKVARAWLEVELNPKMHPPLPKKTKQPKAKSSSPSVTAHNPIQETDDVSAAKTIQNLLSGFAFDSALADLPADQHILRIVQAFLRERGTLLPDQDLPQSATYAELKQWIDRALSTFSVLRIHQQIISPIQRIASQIRAIAINGPVRQKNNDETEKLRAQILSPVQRVASQIRTLATIGRVETARLRTQILSPVQRIASQIQAIAINGPAIQESNDEVSHSTSKDDASAAVTQEEANGAPTKAEDNGQSTSNEKFAFIETTPAQRYAIFLDLWNQLETCTGGDCNSLEFAAKQRLIAGKHEGVAIIARRADMGLEATPFAHLRDLPKVTLPAVDEEAFDEEAATRDMLEKMPRLASSASKEGWEGVKEEEEEVEEENAPDSIPLATDESTSSIQSASNSEQGHQSPTDPREWLEPGTTVDHKHLTNLEKELREKGILT